MTHIRKVIRLPIFCMLLAASLDARAEPDTGTLELSILDADSGETVPARVEIADEHGNFYVAEDALLFGGDCDMSDEGAGIDDLESALSAFSRRIENPYTQSTQFYSDGSSRVVLPAGPVMIRVLKGPEYQAALLETVIAASETTAVDAEIRRWINMADRGWYSADDHLHIPRPDPRMNPYILRHMQAEDINVGNLLQMGKVRNFRIAQQYAYGRDGEYQRGNYIIAAGQENPRTHFVGHAITLGANEPLHDPEMYLVYRKIWTEAAKKGGLNGFAHAHAPHRSFTVAPQDGMAIILPHDLLDFLEVLQWNRSGYEAWYDLLNVGFRIAPTAGTDFPCAGQVIAGHERFYTRVEGKFTYRNWLDRVREGRTFVTSGPMVEFRLNGRDIGDTVVLDSAGTVEISAKIMFDPARDSVRSIEVVRNGDVIRRITRVDESGEISFSFDYAVSEPSWFAVRAYGRQIDERIAVWPLHFASFKATSNLHTAPIYVTLHDEPGIEKSDRAREIARTWLARLEAIESLLLSENLDELAGILASPDFDAVPEETLLRNRKALLREIETAKSFLADRL